ncbi:MAG: gamma carbonic anhydrase family protein [Candidatus Dadabacteria bacterium]|nr:MAG: gamma carbonic anhydrase family protein [Candidatus Dadabacteria bacterium]
MAIIPYKNISPKIDPDSFIAPDAWISGDVEIRKNVSVFFGAVIRGDILPIFVDEETNLQEHCLLHTSHGLTECRVGKRVTVGHRAILHGCTVMDNSLIGMGATVLDGAVIEENCIIGAQSLVPLNTRIPAGSLALGVPAKVVRKLTDTEIEGLLESARSYVETGKVYRDYFLNLKD